MTQNDQPRVDAMGEQSSDSPTAPTGSGPLVEHPIFYVAQERAFAPGIVSEWPVVVRQPRKIPHGRLVKQTHAQVFAALGMANAYPHMCRMGHVEIGHSDSEFEACPLCRALAALKQLRGCFGDSLGDDMADAALRVADVVIAKAEGR